MMEKALKIGRIENEDSEAYHKSGAIGSTRLRDFMESPRKYWWKYLSGNAEAVDSEAMAFGRAFHSVVLERKPFVALPADAKRNSKAGKEIYDAFMAEHSDEIVLRQEDAALLGNMIRYGIERNPIALELIEGCHTFEVSYRAPFQNQVLQCRADGEANDYIIDLKSCRSIGGLVRDFWGNGGYHIQAAFYHHLMTSLGMPPREFKFVGVSKDEGFECTVISLAIDDMERIWERIVCPELERLCECIATDVFPSAFGDEIIAVPTRTVQAMLNPEEEPLSE